MKNLKKNNKGFSLVELIVVVLIMAIIAVALAPQIMKWVKNSRITADQNACGNIKSAVEAGIADYQSKGGVIKDNLTQIKFSGTKTNFSIASGDSSKMTDGTKSLEACIQEALGDEEYEIKYKVSASDGDKFKIDITKNGGVKVTCDATDVSLD